MAFSRPTLQTLRDRIKGDLRTATGVKSIIRRSFLDVISKAIAGVTHMLHGHIVYVSKQIFPDQADAEFLERHGAIYSIDRKAATFAKLNLTITGTDTTAIAAGQIWKRDDGILYEVETAGVITGGVFEAVVVCQTEGSTGNLDAGEILTIQSPIAGVDSEAVVLSANVIGEDEETDESYRERIVARIQQPPSGGTANDFIAYAKEVAGVTRAWVTPGGMGEGTVVLYFVTDNTDPIIPSPAKILEVDENVQLQKPVTAETFTVAPIAKDLNIEVNISPNTVDVQEAIKAEIKDLLTREANVRGTVDGITATFDGKIEVSKIREAISIAAGEEDHVLISPTEDVVPSIGGLVVEGTYTFGAL